MIGQRVNQLRKKRGWSIQKLAAMCAEAGATRLTGNAIENIEYGRRDKSGRRRREVDVSELLALAYVLEVPPVALVVPLDIADDERFELTGEVTAPAGQVRAWFAGLGFLDGQNSISVLARMTEGLPRDQAQKLTRLWFLQHGDEYNRAALAAEAAHQADEQKQHDQEEGRDG